MQLSYRLLAWEVSKGYDLCNLKQNLAVRLAIQRNQSRTKKQTQILHQILGINLSNEVPCQLSVPAGRCHVDVLQCQGSHSILLLFEGHEDELRKVSSLDDGQVVGGGAKLDELVQDSAIP